MPAPRKYPQELRERAIRLVSEAMAEEPGLSLNAAVQRIGPRVGVVPDTLRGRAKHVRADQGLAPGTTTTGCGSNQGPRARGQRTETSHATFANNQARNRVGGAIA